MKTKKEIITKHQIRYKKASKKEKTQILNEVSNTTGLSRNRTIRLLNGSANKKNAFHKKHKQGRKTVYNKDVATLLEKIWILMDFACGKRLKAGINPFLDALLRHGELQFEDDIINKLRIISASSIDRLLKSPKAKLNFKGKSTTKPGTLLKKDIPIRLGNEWDDAVPGFVEIDLVAHCGSTTAGDYVNTLCITDICTGWTETYAILNKAQKHVFNALIDAEQNFPFDYKGIDSDNGSEFINNILYRYCKEHNICFTRSRPNKKNDNAHVEQKNWAVVRKNIGYNRYEGNKAVNLLNRYYQCLSLYSNYFLPQTKLIKKYHNGVRVIKVYEDYLTPYQRVLNSNLIPLSKKEKLTKTFLSLNPVSLKKEMSDILNQLKNIAIPWQR